MSRITAIIYAGVICLLVCLGWLAYYYHGTATDYKKQRDTAQQNLKLSNATITTMETRQIALAALDAKHTKELADAKAENDDLQRKLDAGGRVRVAGKCPPMQATTQSTGTPGVGDAGTVELSPVAGRNVLGIRAGIINDQAALRTLQDYIRTQCLSQ
ncbi:lysis protein [Trabulsiella odontotermitis]|uniref:lysis protein n=1 Tax=Trabulsiella odontotermitis TaxID=379893 RepID=UPI003AD4567D